jgi:hypothetical protein
METVMPDPMTTDIAKLAAELDRWCVRQNDELSQAMNPYIMAGGSIDDPQYRQQLGQHQAFMRMRSYIHGALRAHLQGASRDALSD